MPLELEQLELEQLGHQIQLLDKEHNFPDGGDPDDDGDDDDGDQGTRRNKHQTVDVDDSLLSGKIHHYGFIN